MMLAVVVMTALVLIAISVAAPMIARDLRRDKEVESEHRAQQYVRAIRLYQRKFGAGHYPPSIEALENSNNVRFLRKQYIDPLTGKSDWRIIHQGQQQTTIKIPFGKELAGIASTGLGSAAGIQSSGTPGMQSTGTSLTTGCTGMNAAFCNQPATTSTSGGPGTSGSTGPQSTDASSLGGNTGGPIAGVGPSRSGESILTPNSQSTYESWEFWYDPRIEQLYSKSKILGGGGIGGSGTSSGVSSTSAGSFGQDINGTSNAPKTTTPTPTSTTPQ